MSDKEEEVKKEEKKEEIKTEVPEIEIIEVQNDSEKTEDKIVTKKLKWDDSTLLEHITSGTDLFRTIYGKIINRKPLDALVTKIVIVHAKEIIRLYRNYDEDLNDVDFKLLNTIIAEYDVDNGVDDDIIQQASDLIDVLD